MALTQTNVWNAFLSVLTVLTTRVKISSSKKPDAVKKSDFDIGIKYVRHNLLKFAECLFGTRGGFIVVDGANMMFEAKRRGTSILGLVGSIYGECVGLYDNIVVVIPANHGTVLEYTSVARGVFLNGRWASSGNPGSPVLVVLTPNQAQIRMGVYISSEVDDLAAFAICQFLSKCDRHSVMLTKDQFRWSLDSPRTLMDLDTAVEVKKVEVDYDTVMC